MTPSKSLLDSGVKERAQTEASKEEVSPEFGTTPHKKVLQPSQLKASIRDSRLSSGKKKWEQREKELLTKIEKLELENLDLKQENKRIQEKYEHEITLLKRQLYSSVSYEKP